ncbi:PREDICTED: protein FAM47E [Tinamus guttatus]|uniref:protein FAM47E n=1 Tax=Tinamus guttatus TaxID=94827 RepID=UPI00052E7882|nr:PREDICTED: protein FAM47E [Tinamus guttatus]
MVQGQVEQSPRHPRRTPCAAARAGPSAQLQSVKLPPRHHCSRAGKASAGPARSLASPAGGRGGASLPREAVGLSQCDGTMIPLFLGYKEKLSSRCFPVGSTKQRFSGSLNSQRWRFLKSGLDDFRNGFPPPCGNMVIRGTRGLSPIVLPRRSHQKTGKTSATRSHHLMPQQEAHKDFREERNHDRSQSFYSYLNDSRLPQLLLEMINILEADIQKSFKTAETGDREDILPPQRIRHYSKDKKQMEAMPGSSARKESGRKHLYTSHPKAKIAKREKMPGLSYIPPVTINRNPAATEFCVWDASLGEEIYYINDNTRSDTTNVKVREINAIPAQLRECLGGSFPGTVMKSPHEEPCQRKFHKIRYGAWYLDPKTWKKQKVGEPLMDPKEMDDGVKDVMAPSNTKDIAPSPGMHAFKEFLERKGYRKPRTMDEEEAEATDNEFEREKEPEETFAHFSLKEHASFMHSVFNLSNF